MRAVDRNFVHSSGANIGLMKAALQGKAFETFADLRANVQQFALLEDGELSQIVQDAGFTVEE